MAYRGLIRKAWHRVIVGGSHVLLSTAPRIQQTLEDATNSVAEFTLAKKQGVNYRRNQQVSIDHVRQTDADTQGRNRRRNLFKGRVDNVRGTSFPNEIRVMSHGPLGNLRLTTDEDVDLTGMTDQQAVRRVLEVCGVPFRPGAIKGAGYALGEREDVIWTKNSTGASMVEELDRVFGYATIENGKGEVQRIKYSRVPADYGNNVPRKRVFYRGDPNVTFYENERERGHLEEIVNYWDIAGLEYEVGNPNRDRDGDGIDQEGKEGCSRRIWSECKNPNHPLLGRGVYVGGEFSSDLIQSPALAKAICRRMLEWYNREVDTIRIGCGNDPDITVGTLVEVRDNAPGIDLRQRARYIVTSIQRDGDFMTIDGLGGPAGDVAGVRGGIEECCGSWVDDNECEENEKDDEEEPPPLPDLPELPDPPEEEWCDPGEDPTCIPNDGVTPPDPDVGGPGVDLPPIDQTLPDTGVTNPPPGPTSPTDPDICVPLTVFGTCAPTVGSEELTDGTTNSVLGAPSGTVPMGQITGGMPWDNLNQWDDITLDSAIRHGADPARIKAMMVVESGGVPGVAGVGGAVGLMQVKPDIWQGEADAFGYDLYTNEGQIGFAAALIGGDTPSTAGMDEETAFLTIYYPVYDDQGNLCLTCYGESGHTPQMYLDDLRLFMGEINAAAGLSTGDPGTVTGDGCLEAGAEDDEFVTPATGGDYDVQESTNDSICHVPGWNWLDQAMSGCAVTRNFNVGGFGGRTYGYINEDLKLERIGAIYRPDLPSPIPFLSIDMLAVPYNNRPGHEYRDVDKTDHAVWLKLGKGPVCISGKMRFTMQSSKIRFFVHGKPREIGGQPYGGVYHPMSQVIAEFWSEPGYATSEFPTRTTMAQTRVHSQGASSNSLRSCEDPESGLSIAAYSDHWCNGGDIRGDGLPLFTDIPFQWCFWAGVRRDEGDPYSYQDSTIDLGEYGSTLSTQSLYWTQNGYWPWLALESREGFSNIEWHVLSIDMGTNSGAVTTPNGVAVQVWDLAITGLTEPLLGAGVCEENPDYDPGYTPPTDPVPEYSCQDNEQMFGCTEDGDVICLDSETAEAAPDGNCAYPAWNLALTSQYNDCIYNLPMKVTTDTPAVYLADDVTPEAVGILGGTLTGGFSITDAINPEASDPDHDYGLDTICVSGEVTFYAERSMLRVELNELDANGQPVGVAGYAELHSVPGESYTPEGGSPIVSNLVLANHGLTPDLTGDCDPNTESDTCSNNGTRPGWGSTTSGDASVVVGPDRDVEWDTTFSEPGQILFDVLPATMNGVEGEGYAAAETTQYVVAMADNGFPESFTMSFTLRHVIDRCYFALWLEPFGCGSAHGTDSWVFEIDPVNTYEPGVADVGIYTDNEEDWNNASPLVAGEAIDVSIVYDNPSGLLTMTLTQGSTVMSFSVTETSPMAPSSCADLDGVAIWVEAQDWRDVEVPGPLVELDDWTISGGTVEITGGGLALNELHPFRVCWDVPSATKKMTWGVGLESGYAEAFEDVGECAAVGHGVNILMTNQVGTAQGEPSVRLRYLGVSRECGQATPEEPTDDLG